MNKNIEKINNEDLLKEIFKRIGENPDRKGLKDTPKRIVKMWKEIFKGYDKSQFPDITVFPNGEDGISYNEMVIDEGTFHSFCEHHTLPFFGTYTFAYIPSKNGNILGLSKVARVVNYCSSKFQIQERLVQDIVNHLWNALLKNNKEAPKGMALIIRGTHLCKSMRGIKNEGVMTSSELRGLFKENNSTREEFLRFVN